MSEIKRVLVTGGSGFLGYHVVENLLQRGMEVTVCDLKAIPEVGGQVDMQIGDVRDADRVMELVSRHEGIIHLAGMLGTRETIVNPTLTAEINVLGSLNVFKAAQTHRKRTVYIAVGNHWMNNPYSITKTTAERFALMFNKECGTEIAAVRGLNVYGPRQKDKPVRKMVPNIILPALRGDEITIYGSGNQVMDVIYVTDIAEILVRALLHDHGVYDRVFQAGMGEDTTVNRLADLIVRLTHSSSKVTHVPMRPGEIPDSVVKADPGEWCLETLGWSKEDFVSLEDGMRRTVEYYRANIPSSGATEIG